MPQNTTDEIAYRRSQVSAFYLRGLSQGEIAQKLGVTQPLVSQDLVQIRIDWQTSTLFDFNEQKIQELKKIDFLESQAWENYFASAKPLKKKSTKMKGKAPAGLTAEEKRKQQPDELEQYTYEEERLPDPRYMMVITKCIEIRCKILGLEAPLKTVNFNIPGAAGANGETVPDALPQNRWAIVDMTGGERILAPDEDYRATEATTEAQDAETENENWLD